MGAGGSCDRERTSDQLAGWTGHEGGAKVVQEELEKAGLDRLHVRLLQAENVESLDVWGESDCYVVVRVEDQKLHNQALVFDEVDNPWTHKFPVRKDTKDPTWFESGMVLFKRGTETFRITVYDKDCKIVGGDDVLLNETFELPKVGAGWEELDIDMRQGGILRLKIKATGFEEKFTDKDVEFQEKIFELEDGQKAVLQFRNTRESGAKKAVVYVPGRNDCFAHPHLVQLFEELGFDLYALSYRSVGYCRKHGFLENGNFTSHVPSGSFDVLSEELDKTVRFVTSKKEYVQVFAMGFGTGATIIANYMLEKRDKFDGFILNGPFFDWGERRSSFNEWFLENVPDGLRRSEIPKYDHILQPANPFLDGTTLKTWSLYPFDLSIKPLNRPHLTFGFVHAAKHVLDKLEAVTTPLSSKPTFCISSQNQDTSLARKFSCNMTTIEMQMGQQDLFLSFDSELTSAALMHLKAWLQTL